MTGRIATQQRRLKSKLTLAFAVFATLAAGYLYSIGITAASACGSASIQGRTTHGLEVAQRAGGPWRSDVLPALSGQIDAMASRLIPGSAGQMVAYVRNTGSSPGVTSIAVADLVDGGGTYTEPEREMQPRRDTGDLSANIVLTVTYESSLRPSDRRVVVRGTLRELASSGRVFASPVQLQPYSARGTETGVWRIDLAVPRSADNRIQGDRTSCTVVFGLTQATR